MNQPPEGMTPEERYEWRTAEIKRLQAEREHYQKRIGQCILAGGAVFVFGMLAVIIMAAMGV